MLEQEATSVANDMRNEPTGPDAANDEATGPDDDDDRVTLADGSRLTVGTPNADVTIAASEDGSNLSLRVTPTNPPP